MVCLPACESFIELGDDGLGVVLMMNAQICTADTSHIIWLSYSSPSSIVPVEDGVVSCFVNGQLVSTVDAMSVENEIPLSVSGNVSYGVGGYCSTVSLCGIVTDKPRAPISFANSIVW